MPPPSAEPLDIPEPTDAPNMPPPSAEPLDIPEPKDEATSQMDESEEVDWENYEIPESAYSTIDVDWSQVDPEDESDVIASLIIAESALKNGMSPEELAAEARGFLTEDNDLFPDLEEKLAEEDPNPTYPQRQIAKPPKPKGDSIDTTSLPPSLPPPPVRESELPPDPEPFTEVEIEENLEEDPSKRRQARRRRQ